MILKRFIELQESKPAKSIYNQILDNIKHIDQIKPAINSMTKIDEEPPELVIQEIAPPNDYSNFKDASQ